MISLITSSTTDSVTHSEINIRENRRDNQGWIIQRHWTLFLQAGLLDDNFFTSK